MEHPATLVGVTDPGDIIRTPGSESNVKEIYDACNELARDPTNFVLNQFCEFGNYLGHLRVTGPAFARVFDDVAATHPGLALPAVPTGFMAGVRQARVKRTAEDVRAWKRVP